MTRSGQVTTFYSYKGGVGRTFLLANVAWLLARWGRRVLVVDWDLEAPGVHHYLTPGLQPRHGLLDLLTAFGEGRELDWRAVTSSVDGPWEEGGALDLIGAGAQDDAYLGAMQRLDWTRLFDQGLAEHLEGRRAEWVAAYDHVFLDSRTGLSDVGSICAAQLPDVLVMALTAAQQSIDGILDVEKRARSTRVRLPLDRGRFRCVPIPTRLHLGEELALESEWMARLAERLSPLMDSWRDEDVDVLSYFAHLRIPEFARWSYGEPLPVREERLDEPSRVSWAFANLAALVDRRLQDSGAMVRERNTYVGVSAGKAGLGVATVTPMGSYDAYLSVSVHPRALEAGRQLREALNRAGLKTFSAFDLRPGATLPEDLWRGIAASRAVVVLLGPDEPPGVWQRAEIEHADRLSRERRVRVIPVFADELSSRSAPTALQSYFGLSVRDEGSWDMIAKKIAASIR